MVKLGAFELQLDALGPEKSRFLRQPDFKVQMGFDLYDIRSSFLALARRDLIAFTSPPFVKSRPRRRDPLGPHPPYASQPHRTSEKINSFYTMRAQPITHGRVFIRRRL